jgi:siroheme synthase-like protein
VTTTGWPVSLRIAGLRVVVVGAGPVAARRIGTLLEEDADVMVIAPEVGDDVRGWADQGRLSVQTRPFRPSDLDGAWLALTATGIAAVDAAVKAAGDERRMLVCSAGGVENSSFTMLSTARRADLIVAVGTGGRSPALAAWLCRRIDAEIGREYETMVELLHDVRTELQASGRATDEVDWRRALDGGMLDLVQAGRIDEARELLRSCL